MESCWKWKIENFTKWATNFIFQKLKDSGVYTIRSVPFFGMEGRNDVFYFIIVAIVNKKGLVCWIKQILMEWSVSFIFAFFKNVICNRSKILIKTIGNLIWISDSFVILYETTRLVKSFRFYVDNLFYAFPILFIFFLLAEKNVS